MALDVLDLARGQGRTVVGVTAVVDSPDLVGRSIELARLLGIHGDAPVVLVEATFRSQSRLAGALGMDATPGLTSALERPERADRLVRATPDPRLFVLTSGANWPITGPVSAERLARVADVLRGGGWITRRPVVDLEADEMDEAEVAGQDHRFGSATLPSGPSGSTGGIEELPSGRPWWVEPPSHPSAVAAWEEPKHPRPFNEGPWPRGGPAAPPEPVTASEPLRPMDRFRPAPRQGGWSGPGGPPVALVMAPPLDDLTDGDLVARQCDQLVLVVHSGAATRSQLAEAVHRCGPERFVGAVLVTPARRRAH